MAINYIHTYTYIFHSQAIQNLPKIWFENIPSGNPADRTRLPSGPPMPAQISLSFHSVFPLQFYPIHFVCIAQNKGVCKLTAKLRKSIFD
jgi:hypothetical protein